MVGNGSLASRPGLIETYPSYRLPTVENEPLRTSVFGMARGLQREQLHVR